MITRILLPALIFASAIPGDTLRLRDGSSVNGDFLGATADDIRFSVNGEVRHLARVNVAEIIFSPAPDDVAPPASQSAPASTPAGNSEPDWVVRGPDYANAPFLRGATGFISFEREVAVASRGGMYGMGATVYRIQGAHSNVRVRQSDRVVFVVRFESSGDPRHFQLFRLESRMGYRQTPISNGGMPMGLPLTITQVGDRVYEITPTRTLAPGEYAVSPANSNDSYCFGVDY